MVKKNKTVLWIAQTAVFTALLISMQAATAQFGNTFVTGSIVNLILIMTVMLCGIFPGMSVAVISPIFAKLFNIGPFWPLIPFIALGNLVLVLIWCFMGNQKRWNMHVAHITALIAAAAGKFITLYTGVVLVAIPYLLDLNEKQTEVISNMFSFQQLITASIGGVIAVLILPVVKKAVKSRG